MRHICQPEEPGVVEKVLDLAERHVFIIAHVVRVVCSRATAYRTVKRLWKERRLRSVGSVILTATGPAVRAFCNGWKPKRDQLRHEILTTDFLLSYPTAEFVRGWDVDPKIRPDATMTLDGITYHIETDTGSESFRRIEKRQQVYAGVDDFVLYVTLSDRRMDGLMRHSEKIDRIALFTTLQQAIADPRGDIWQDYSGNVVSI